MNTPIAATGPRVWIEPTSATSRTSMARVTVSPLARIAGPHAPDRALHRLVLVLVATQFLAVARHSSRQ